MGGKIQKALKKFRMSKKFKYSIKLLKIVLKKQKKISENCKKKFQKRRKYRENIRTSRNWGKKIDQKWM